MFPDVFSTHSNSPLCIFPDSRHCDRHSKNMSRTLGELYVHLYENSCESCYPNRTTTTLKYPTSQLDALRVLKTVVEFATIDAEPLYISYNFMYNHHHDYFACVVRIVMHVLLSLVSKVVDRWVNSLWPTFTQRGRCHFCGMPGMIRVIHFIEFYELIWLCLTIIVWVFMFARFETSWVQNHGFNIN